MKSSKKLQILSHLLFVYINNQDRKWRMSVLVFSSALEQTRFVQYTNNAKLSLTIKLSLNYHCTTGPKDLIDCFSLNNPKTYFVKIECQKAYFLTKYYFRHTWVNCTKLRMPYFFGRQLVHVFKVLFLISTLAEVVHSFFILLLF